MRNTHLQKLPSEHRCERLSAGFLKIWPLFGQNRPFNGTDLQADPAIDAGVEIDHVEISAFGVFAVALVDTGHWAGINAIGDAFAHLRNDGVRHGKSISVG